MARPKKGEEKKATAAIGLRVPLDLREALEAAARAHGRTLTDEATHAIRSYISQLTETKN